jgi:hypothetical protein
MGYEAPRKVYKLVFEDHGDLIVRTHSLPLGRLLSMSELIGADPRNLSSDNLQKMTGLFSTFADALLDWNLEADGQPVPATLDGLNTLDTDFVLEVITAWMNAVAGVARPLARPSDDGAPSVAESIPMATLSPNLAS